MKNQSSTKTPEPIRVLLVDDHAIVRVGLRNIINDESDLRVVGEAGSCAAARREAKETNPDVIVLDLRLPDGSGVEIIEAFKRAKLQSRVLVLTSFADDTLLLAALKAGADGYLLKDVAEADLIGAIREIARAGAVTPSPALERRSSEAAACCTTEHLQLNDLTGQERRVFELVARGHSNREVSHATGLTEKTVRNYLSRVFDKLSVRRRSQLVALYISGRHWRK